jgi:hypothetical protein
MAGCVTDLSREVGGSGDEEVTFFSEANDGFFLF